MTLNRRGFVASVGWSFLASAAARGDAPKPAAAAGAENFSDWSQVRVQFDLSPEWLHFSQFYIVSHPRPVRAAIERYRRMLDANPFATVEHGMGFAAFLGQQSQDVAFPVRVQQAAAQYLGGRPDEVALTDSTTTGLALIYNGLTFTPGDEILTTNHDHYVHHQAIRLATERNGASWRKIPLWESWSNISADGIVDHIRREIRPNTRVVGVTWVHSQSGVRLPIRRIADMIADVNRDRANRVLLVVDGVHGVGVEDPRFTALGADAFSAGLHKWIFAPRGTGFVWAKPEVWATMRPLIPSFSTFELFNAWGEGHPPTTTPKAAWFTPGGFQSFEHQWAVPAAIDFHNAIGSERITQRIHALNQQMNVEVRKLPNVKIVYTPLDPQRNEGMVCFHMNGHNAQQTVNKLLEKKIIASTTPYAVPFARLAFGIMNTSDEVERTARALRSIG